MIRLLLFAFANRRKKSFHVFVLTINANFVCTKANYSSPRTCTYKTAARCAVVDVDGCRQDMLPSPCQRNLPSNVATCVP